MLSIQMCYLKVIPRRHDNVGKVRKMLLKLFLILKITRKGAIFFGGGVNLKQVLIKCWSG